MRKRILIGLLIFIFCLPKLVYAVEISAVSAVVIDRITGRVLYEKNASQKRAMASTTKIMTALVALEDGRLEDTVTVSKKATLTEGSSMWLTQGEKLPLNDLLYGLMLNSGNDAAVAIAEHIAGSTEQFVSRMNQKAKEIGANNTSFATANGLDATTHYSTAYDMALITRQAFTSPLFAKI
ncbi:MAG: D-alanyl-D-alanine carboxypeptidase, partial [Hyphomonadaceae bacterium]|nr:D-alanyl-D-alanine carboxypeptidase [Clostridia bacterium]